MPEVDVFNIRQRALPVFPICITETLAFWIKLRKLRDNVISHSHLWWISGFPGPSGEPFSFIPEVLDPMVRWKTNPFVQQFTSIGNDLLQEKLKVMPVKKYDGIHKNIL